MKLYSRLCCGVVHVQKGFGYHLDLFVLALLIIVCSLLGLPWFVAATVRSVTHVRSLIKLSDVSAPGERPEMLGVRLTSAYGVSVHRQIFNIAMNISNSELDTRSYV